MKRLLLPALLLFAAAAPSADWPREISGHDGLITIYQPQITAFDGNAMSARAAFSVTPAGETAPMFGSVWMDCHVLTDHPTRTVRILDLRVKQIRFPNRSADETAAISASMEQRIPRWDLTFSLDELLESLDTAQKERENARDIDLTPPRIIVMDRPAVLVQIDGDPIYSDVEGTNLRRVVNTPYFVAQEVSSGTLYLRGGDNWYSARDLAGPWRVTGRVPQEVVDVSSQTASDDPSTQEAPASAPAPGTARIPEIVVSTVPTELIASDGPLQFSPIDGTGLLYAGNTQSKLFLAIDSRAYYILISGRWFTSPKLDGQWMYVASDKLPSDFARIPPGSDRDAVLASVAGTLPAKEAVLDSQIPQTAEVDRMETSEQVDYDGDPQFERIENTDMEYAVNTATPVVLVGARYYACDRGIWFESYRARGPWAVSVAIPAPIYRIPPRCPIYYVRYVRIYSYTPSVVYVGYTAGYTGCYVYNHTVVYGTGYRYHPWFRHYYYPRPWTWGFGVHYE
ncbi:MAG TPA: carbohydrate-binding family V/XII, partial [Bacteroidota bacterium]|nr:carbohydrate-binding family V/XII [Bacteroidota bacterium]